MLTCQLDISPRLPALHVHAKRERNVPLLGQSAERRDDRGERPLASTRDLEQIPLAEQNQLADAPDVGILEGVLGTRLTPRPAIAR